MLVSTPTSLFLTMLVLFCTKLTLLISLNTTLFPAALRQVEAHGDHQKTIIGLSLNGGSYTAANGGAAFMRGFQRQKLMIDGEERPGLEAFHHVGALSGGNLPNVMYHFSQSATTDELFDLVTPGYTDPTTITMQDLSIAPPLKSMFSRFVTDVLPFFALTIAYISIFGGAFNQVLQSFSILMEVGIAMNSPMSSMKIRDGVKSKPCFSVAMIGPEEIFPEWVYSTMNARLVDELVVPGALVLVAEVPGLGPIYEMNLTHAMEALKKHGYQIPLYGFHTDEALHVPGFSSEAVTMEFDAVGNKTAEPLEFKGFTVSHDDLSTQSDPVTLNKIVGIATDTFVINQFLSDIVVNTLGLPSPHMTWDIPTADGHKRRMVFSDGGYSDSNALPALLKQGVRKIVLSHVPSPFGNLFAYSFLQYFGLAIGAVISTDFFSAAQACVEHLFDNENSKGAGNTQFDKLVNNLQSLHDAGEPMITTLEGLEVIDNPFYGIKGGYKVDVTFYLGTSVPQKFVELLPPGVAVPPIGQNMTTKDGFGMDRFTNEDFRMVPVLEPIGMLEQNFSYTFPGSNETLELDGVPGLGQHFPVEPTRMTELMITWIVEHAWDNPLVGIDGEVKFAGFRKFLEEDVHEDKDDKEDLEDTASSDAGSFAKTSIFIMTVTLSMIYLIV